MIAKHLFIFKDAFNPDEQVTGGAQGLETKYGPKSYSITTLWLDGTKDKITTEGSTQSTNSANANNVFPNRVGVYLITHMNNPFTLAKSGASIADMICSYLDTRDDLQINCTMLDKLVIVSCVGAERLRKDFVDKTVVTKIKLKPDNPDSQKSYAKKYTELSKPWDEKRQEALNKGVLDYESKGEAYFNAKADNVMVMLACALDRRGAHPKIAAWDDALYVRSDGRKSTDYDRFGPGNPIKPHERILSKMMIQFTRTGNGPGSIRQLQLQEWSDKPI
jgi:hypothetical protein